MVGLLSLPDELIEAVGERVIRSHHDGLRDWCRVTSTCKRLWDMQLPGSVSHWSMKIAGDLEGALWKLQRIQLTRSLSVYTSSLDPLEDVDLLDLDVLRHNVKALIRATRALQSLTSLDIDIDEENVYSDGDARGQYFQQWVSALLLASPRLASLSVRTDSVPLPPVMGLLSVRHLELTMQKVKPWLKAIMADLSLCSCLETLKIEDDLLDHETVSKGFPEVLLHDVASLKSVDFLGWYPEEEVTLPPGCVLHSAVVLETPARWLWLQKKKSTSMLYLVCMPLQGWPFGIEKMSGLRYLELTCTSMQGQDLAALQHIPYVRLVLQEFSTFCWTGGSWRSLEITGRAGFKVDFSSADAFVRGTERFLFESTSQDTGDMHRELRAACLRQGVACHECAHQGGWHADDTRDVTLSNVKLCRGPRPVNRYRDHDHFMRIDPSSRVWPCRAKYPELYSQD